MVRPDRGPGVVISVLARLHVWRCGANPGVSRGLALKTGTAVTVQSGGVVSTVVVVDDHAGFRSTVRRLLERDGYLVVAEAIDGESALTLLHRVHPSFVLLDVALPDIDGFGVLRELRRRGDFTPVVLVSSRNRQAYAGSLMEADALGFLIKGDLDAASLNSLVSKE
jgi:CheY-like chemotaxis protein